MSANDELRSQDWRRVTAQLTAFAWKRTARRSWDLAADLAQEAIAQAFMKPDAWDPAKEPLLKNLARRVIGLASNERRRRRNSFERALDEEIEGSLGAADIISDGKATPDESLDQQRYSDAFRKRLGARLAGDPTALTIIAFMMEGIDDVADQSAATRLTLEQVREARRRIYYHSEETTKELALELDAKEALQ